MRIVFLAMISAVLAATSAFANDCADVYRDAVRNYHVSDTNYASLNALFDNYCQSTGEMKQSSAGGALDVVAESIPISLSGSDASAESRVSNFCRNYSSVRTTQLAQSTASSEVVVSALSNYNLCRQIESKYGVTITNAYSETAIVFNFDFANSNTNFTIEGVSATPAMSCEINAEPLGAFMWGTFGNPAVDARTFRTYQKNFSMICTRSFKDDNGKKVYDAASVAIATNLGSYVVKMPADEIYSNKLASDATAKINALETSNADLQSKLGAAINSSSDWQAKYNAVSVVGVPFVQGQHNPGGAAFTGCGSDLQAFAKSLCVSAAGTENATLLHVVGRGGDQCGYEYFVAICVAGK